MIFTIIYIALLLNCSLLYPPSPKPVPSFIARPRHDTGAPQTLEDLDVAMEVVIDSETGMPATDAVAAAKRRGVTDTIRTYIAALRACGKGRAEPRDVLGVLERIRWAGVVEANEGVYAAAIRALRVCGSDGGGGGGVSGGVGGGVVGASEAARDLIEWDGKRGSTGANLFLYR